MADHRKWKVGRSPVSAVLSLFLIIGCGSSNGQTQDQGIKGKVLLLEGNVMPGPDRKKPAGQPVVRTLHIYKVLLESSLEKEGDFYVLPEQAPVKVIKSDAEGKFSVDLPPGTYSLLSKEKQGLYANLFDGQGHIYPVEVQAGKYTEVVFKIDYGAFY